MKKRLKIKQFLLGIGISVLGLLTFNNNEINAQFNVISANPNVQTGEYVYKVLDNYYYSNNANTYIFNESSKTWIQHSWSGLPTSIYGNYFWTDGETYYYGGSSTSQQYYYNPDTNAWINYSSSVASYGNYIWTDGNYTYFSNSSTQKYWNKANKTWMNMSWGGLTSFTGNNVWKDGNNIYYSSGSTQYKLNTSTSTWSQIGYNTPSTMRNLNGQDVWTDGANTYYSGTSPTSSSATYNFIFDGVDTWTEINLGGFDRFEGRNVYNIGNDTYFTYYFATYGWNMSSGYSQEDLDNAYNEGYNEGTIFGSNNGLMINTCTFNNLITGPCGTQYYTLTNGSIDFDSLNDYVYNLGTGNSYSITFTFTDSISADSLLYARFKETEGSYISFYNDNTLLETLYNSDFDSNQSDYYKTFRLSDFGQITSSFNKIVINNISYDYAISEFGVLQNQSYNLGEENGEIYGYNSGFTNGNIVGYERGYKDGEERGNNIVNLVGTVFTQPVNMLATIFNFEFLGVNLSGFIFSLVTLLVVIWLIKRFI